MKAGHPLPDADEGALQLPQVRVPTLATLAGLVLGVGCGILADGSGWAAMALRVIEPVGTLWLHGLQMTILPLVSALLVLGVVRTAVAARAGAMARLTLVLFITVLLTFGAISAVLTPLLLSAFPVPQAAGAALRAGIGSLEPPQGVPGLSDYVLSLVPANAFAAAAQGALLPVIVFFAAFAAAIIRLPVAQRQTLLDLFQAIAAAMVVIVGWVLKLAPLGVFALGFVVARTAGAAALGALVHYIAIVSSIGLLVIACGYGLARLGGGQPLVRFARAMLPAQAVAISTQSSLASVPAMLAACRALGLRDATGEFVLPLGVALFRATGPAMNIAVGIYLASLLGIELHPAAILAAVLVAPLASIGSPSLPNSVSFVSSMALIVGALGVPVAPLALLVAVEMLPDIVRTVGNVTWDVAVAALVDRRAGGQASSSTSQ